MTSTLELDSVHVAPRMALRAVVAVDDDISVHESLKPLMAQAGWRPREFPVAEEALASPPQLPGCLVLDVRSVFLEGSELQRHLEDQSDLPVIFLSGRDDVAMAIGAMAAGAIEFLSKPVRHETAVDIVEDAVERSRVKTRERQHLAALCDRYNSLTLRERQVMALVVRGFLNKQVSGELGISEITVKAHRGRVMKKMGARSLPELVIIADRLGHATAGKH